MATYSVQPYRESNMAERKCVTKMFPVFAARVSTGDSLKFQRLTLGEKLSVNARSTQSRIYIWLWIYVDGRR